MTLRVHWFLPTAGDGRDVVPGDRAARREPTIEYLLQVGRAAETLGFDGALTPTGTWCEDGATTLRPPEPAPAIYFGGASPPAERVASRYGDVYLAWGEPPAMIGERLERMREAEERQHALAHLELALTRVRPAAAGAGRGRARPSTRSRRRRSRGR